MDDLQQLEDKIGQSVVALKNRLRKTNHEYHEDAGHAWLKVSKSTLIMLGIADQISGYSYEYMGQVYLEEDQDAIIYLKALWPDLLGTETFRQWQSIYVKEINDGDSSSIRQFPSYKP